MLIDDVRTVDTDKKKSSFSEYMLSAAERSCELGLSVLCIHADADSTSNEDTVTNKFEPFFEELERQSNDTHCKNIVMIIPVRETESWMLADKELFKQRINAVTLSDNDLGINKRPEDFSNPKEIISKAISRAQEERTRRRRHDLTIADLYDDIGRLINLDKLRQVPSFLEFENGAREALIRLGYIIKR